MTTQPDKYQKHAALKRPALGDFGRNEIGILGAPCGLIRELCQQWCAVLSEQWKVSFVDADHHEEAQLWPGANLIYTDKISFGRIDFKRQHNPFRNRTLFNDQDLILINGNHFKAQKQIAIIHPAKSLEKKLEKLTDVQLIVLADGITEVPAFLNHLADVPVLRLEQQAEIVQFLQTLLTAAIPPLHGLVLAGGKGIRMQTDKGSIAYHGQNQRIHTHHLLAEFCDEVSLSGAEEEGLPTIPDTFIGLGPFGGILSAMQKNPNAAWFTLACDLPYLTSATLQYLVERRNPSKLATAFLDSDGQFPEPLITIWEPRAYPVMLQFLSQGYSCPRKVLINSDIELLQAPDVKEFRNVNRPEERDEALRFFKGEASA